jgi:hypothetical protein
MKNNSGYQLRNYAAGHGSMTLLVLIGLWLSGAPDRAEATWSKGGCKAHTLVDFNAALERMRPAARLPAGEKLPFAKQVHLVPTNTAAVGPTTIGFSIYRDDRHPSSRGRGWNMASRLTLVRKNGAARRVLGTKQGSFDPISRGNMRSKGVGGFHVSVRPAFYRVDVEFEDGPNRHVRYWNYYRVLRKHRDLRLTLSDTSVRAGDALLWRFNNFGTTSVSYGLPYEIERFDEASGEWKLDSLTPPGFPSVGFYLGPGKAGDCQSLVLPAETPDGRYRLSKEARIGAGSPRLVSEFTVGE